MAVTAAGTQTDTSAEPRRQRASSRSRRRRSAGRTRAGPRTARRVSRDAASAGRSRGHRARPQSVQRQLLGVSRRRRAWRTAGRPQSPAIAARAPRSERRADPPGGTEGTSRERHAAVSASRERHQGHRGIHSQPDGCVARTGRAAGRRRSAAKYSRRRCQRRTGVLRREVQLVPFHRPAICRASRRECRIPSCCRTSGSPAACERSRRPGEAGCHRARPSPSPSRRRRARRSKDACCDRRLRRLTDARGRNDQELPPRGRRPKVELHDPLEGHRTLLAVYTDKDMHDVTAYLVTLK